MEGMAGMEDMEDMDDTSRQEPPCPRCGGDRWRCQRDEAWCMVRRNRRTIAEQGWVVIDEVAPAELRTAVFTALADMGYHPKPQHVRYRCGRGALIGYIAPRYAVLAVVAVLGVVYRACQASARSRPGAIWWDAYRDYIQHGYAALAWQCAQLLRDGRTEDAEALIALAAIGAPARP